MPDRTKDIVVLAYEWCIFSVIFVSGGCGRDFILFLDLSEGRE
jgi:hypothetical protein